MLCFYGRQRPTRIHIRTHIQTMTLLVKSQREQSKQFCPLSYGSIVDILF